MWLRRRFGIQEIGVWLPIDTFKLAITVASGFCQGIAENQWDASRRLENQFSALPMGWPVPVCCLSACHLSYLAFFVVAPWPIGRPRVPCWEACLWLPPTQGGTYPTWHLPKVAKLASGRDTEWWLFWPMTAGGAMLQDDRGHHH